MLGIGNLSVAALLLLLAPNQCTFSCSRNHFLPEPHSYCKAELDQGTIDLCHVNDFNSTTTPAYRHIQLVNVEDLTPAVLFANMEQGQPFGVKGVTEGWKARGKWTEEHFRSVFASFELFSSTFATNVPPVFGSSPRGDRDIYYGIFVNDKNLAQVLAEDYTYPTFIPQDLTVQGRMQIN